MTLCSIRTCYIFAAVLLAVLHAVCGLYGGDMVLTREQQASLEAKSNRNNPLAPQNAVVRDVRNLWPNAVVPFIIDNSLGTQARNAIMAAIDDYKRLSCVNFIPRTTERDYVRFFQGQGCFSFIGRVSGPQDISIGRGCEFKGIALHEMFHALGRFHEQSRPDRDTFVRINRANIQAGMESNFDIAPTNLVTTQSISYDIRSIMHYGAFDFSSNGQPTIVPVDRNIALRDLGQRDGLTDSDISHVNTLYCTGGVGGTWSQWQSWTSCSQTCNGGTRTRMRTCIGGTDCPGSNIQTEMCNTNSCPVPASWGTWTQWGDCSATCGGGRQQRTRICVGGNNCIGNNAEFRDCNTQNCPQSATWAPWGSWSACSSTCQGGMRQRTRRCQNGNTCPGTATDMEFCNSNIPCTDQPINGEWSQWSPCTAQCGGGTRFRARMCGQSDCSVEEQNCNTQPCTPEPRLRGLVRFGCYIVPRFSNTLDLLEGMTPDLSDEPTNRTEPIRKCGTGAQDRDFRIFAVSTGYCISGSNRQADYSREGRRSMCSDGVGAFVSNTFLMDVYVIEDPVAFQASVAEITAPTTMPPPSVIIPDSNRSASAPVISTSLTLLFFIAYLCVWLQ